MHRRALVLAVLALSLGGCGAFLNYRWLEARANAGAPQIVEKAPATVPVIVAKTAIGVGAPLRDVQLASVDWPASFAPEGSFHRIEDVVSRLPRRALGSGEPVLEASLLPVGSAAGLSPIIAPGRRAVAVRVDDVIGIAGFILPNSIVDVLATIHDRTHVGSDSFSKVILQGVKVLAIDQSLEERSGADPKLVSVVTLEVTPPEAQQLTFAAHEGKLQLALRNPGDAVEVTTSSVSAGNLRGSASPAFRPQARVEVIKGLDVSNQKF